MSSKYAGLVQDDLRALPGSALVGAVVKVFEAGTETLATLYDNPVEITAATGADALVNHATTGLPTASSLLQPGIDVAANYTFYADSDEDYDVQVTYQGSVFTFRARPNLYAPSGTFADAP